MANNTDCTPVIATVRPKSTEDRIATAFAEEIKGGLHALTNLTAANAIFDERRIEGMLIATREGGPDGRLYQLRGGVQNRHLKDVFEPTDRMNGLNTLRLNYWMNALVDLNGRSLDADDTTLRSSTNTTASQTGNIITISAGADQGYHPDKLRRFMFADGTDAVILDVILPAGYPTNPIKQFVVDRSATVAAQAWRIQAAGICMINPGDSTGYTSLTDARNLIYRTAGYGGAWIGPTSDTTIGDYEFVTLAGGAATHFTSFNVGFAGMVWLVPAGGSVDGSINAKYRAGTNDQKQVFDIRQKERVTDFCNIFWEKKPGALLDIEIRQHHQNNWTKVGTGIDAGAGAEYLGEFAHNHGPGVCWHYRITVTQDTNGGGVKIVGIYSENRAKPGAVFVCADTGGSKLSDYNQLNVEALRQLNRRMRFTMMFLQFRDYGRDANGNPVGQVPDMPAQLDAWWQKWLDAGTHINIILSGPYQNDDNNAHYETEVYRDFSLRWNVGVVQDQRAIFYNFAEADVCGDMIDGVHGGGAKMSRVLGTLLGIQLGLFDMPWGRMPRDIRARLAEFDELWLNGRDVGLALDAGAFGPWDNGVRALQASGWGAWASGLPAAGTGGCVVQLWFAAPEANPSSSIQLCGTYPGESTSNAAKTFSCIIDTSGRLSITLRNYTNDASGIYRFADFLKFCRGRRGCLTIVMNPALDHPLVWFCGERVNDNCVGTYSPGVGVVQPINHPFDFAGTSFNLGITQTHHAHACAYWAGVIPPEAELMRNSERGAVVGATAPTAYWRADTGSGRQIRSRYPAPSTAPHLLLRNASGNARNNPGNGVTEGFAWLHPRKGARTLFRMTSNELMGVLPGETIVMDMATAPLVTLPAIADPEGAFVEFINVGAGLARIAQAGAATQILTGAGATDGVDRTTAGTTGYVQFGARYSSMRLQPITADLWHTPAFPAGATIAVAASGTATPEAANVTGARMAALLSGGIQSFGSPFAPWSVIPALGTGGWTLAWTGLVPAVAPVSTVSIARTSSNRSTSAVGGSLDVGFNPNGRLAISARTADNTSSRAWQLSNFITAYAGRLVRLTIRFNPAAADPEVWVEDAKVSGTGTLTWVVQDVGTPPTMATADFSGTNCMVGCDSPCYQFALWAGVLADAQIAENQRNGAVVGATAPLCHYTFQEGEGRTSRDLSGNGRDVQFLNSGGSSGNDAGNGITTGVRWLRRRRRSTVAVTANNGLLLRPGERTVTNAPVTRVACTLAPLVELDGGDITLENAGAAGFLLTLPTGHKAVTGAGVTVGTDATSAGGTITSNQLYAACVLRPLIVNSSTDVTWRLVTASGVTLA